MEYNKSIFSNQLKEILGEDRVLIEEPMCKHTTFRIGGAAEWFVLVHKIEELQEVTTLCREQQVPYYVVGNGSDLLVSDTGVSGVIIRLAGDFETIELEELPETVEIKTSEKVVTRYVDPLDFVADPTKNGIFENIGWLARCIHLSKEKIKSFFGADTLERLIQKQIVPLDSNDDFVLDVYEIWDKEEKKVYWFIFEADDFFLCQKEDPLGLSGFFPMAKPIFSSMTNDSLIPVSDFQMIEGLLEEFSGLTERMRLLMNAIKVSGVYDASFSRLSDIFDKDSCSTAVWAE